MTTIDCRAKPTVAPLNDHDDFQIPVRKIPETSLPVTPSAQIPNADARCRTSAKT